MNIQMMVLPGGRLPDKKTPGANGYDVYARAIVDPNNMDPLLPYMRKTFFDFKSAPDFSLQNSICEIASGLAYKLLSGESVLVGLGFVAALPSDFCYTVLARSGFILNPEMIVVIPTLVDSDYRGEPSVRLWNVSDRPFYITHQMRVAQILFQKSYSPDFEMINDYNIFPQTDRGAKGGGSTGLT